MISNLQQTYELPTLLYFVSRWVVCALQVLQNLFVSKRCWKWLTFFIVT